MSAGPLFPCCIRWGNRGCNIVENGDAIVWKNNLQLFGKSTCKKHNNRFYLEAKFNPENDLIKLED
jgi:hypothetical protein